MKYLLIFFIFLSTLSSCQKPKKNTENKRVENTDSTNYKETVVSKTYLKDSSFFMVYTPDNFTIYMKYRGKYRKVYALAGGDILFVYTDSTKSRYLYDKRGKHFLKGKERNKYFDLFLGTPIP